MLVIDFDDTLNFSNKKHEPFIPNKDLLSILKEKEFLILTARNDTPENIDQIDKFIKEYSLNPKEIIFTENKEKGPFLKDLSENYEVSTLVDDKEYQRNSAEDAGFVAYHPDEFVEKYLKKESRYNKIKKIYNFGA